MNLGDLIKKERKKAGLTQAALAEKCGMYDSQIRKYESGINIPKLDTLHKIIQAIGISSEDFFSELDPEDGDVLLEPDVKIVKTELLKMREDLIKNYDTLSYKGKKFASELIKSLSQYEKK